MRGRLVTASIGIGMAAMMSGAEVQADLYVQGVGDDHTLAEQVNRFYTVQDRDFVAEHLDLSGIGKSSNGRWVTMISDRYFVSAYHYYPSAGRTVTFHTGNAGSAAVTATVDDWVLVTSDDAGTPSDVMVGRLTEPLSATSGITHYPIMDVANESEIEDLPVYIYGKDHRVGTNTIDFFSTAYYTRSDGSSVKTRGFWMDYDGVGGTGATEGYVMPGDSGGPVFTEVGGKVQLLGINLKNSTGSFDPFNGAYSTASYLGAYADQVYAYVPPAVSTPEPASLCIMGLGALLVGWRNRRA